MRKACTNAARPQLLGPSHGQLKARNSKTNKVPQGLSDVPCRLEKMGKLIPIVSRDTLGLLGCQAAANIGAIFN
jgi:hypothetical protein